MGRYVREMQLISAGPNGGALGARAPRRGCECPKKNFFHALYDIARIYGNAYLYDITAPLKENVAVGAQTRL